MACCCQCFHNSLDIEKVVELGSAGKQRMGMVGNSVETSNDECLAASEYNAVVDEVNYTNGYVSMATAETHSDAAMMMMMDYKVMVVLLFASPADR